MATPRMIDVTLSRIVLRDGEERQFIVLAEVEGTRGFPIVIGNNEASEIQRVVHGVEPERPLTHQLAFAVLSALGARLQAVEIVDLKQNTFFARLWLETPGAEPIAVDARPSDAIALALRAKCPIRVAEEVLAKASDTQAP
ncbi:MAG TPA: bifunctional nuclease family protein [Planctomycetota bacterium]